MLKHGKWNIILRKESKERSDKNNKKCKWLQLLEENTDIRINNFHRMKNEGM